MEKPQGTLIVTGAAGGIGRAIAERFAADFSDKYTGVFTVRNTRQPNTQLLRKTLIKARNPITISLLELTSLSNIRSFASEINTRVSTGSLPPITALVLNAGYMSKRSQSLTSDGYETTFQVNYLSNFLLVLLLLQSMHPLHAHVVFVTSWTHDPYDPHSRALPLERQMWRPVPDLAAPSHQEKKLGMTTLGLRRYAESKLWGMMFMHKLQSRVNAVPALRHISALAVDPGCVFSTDIMREQPWIWRRPLRRFLMIATPIVLWLAPNGALRTAGKAARDILNACFEVDGPVAGSWPRCLYLNGDVRKVSSVESRDEVKQKELWEGSLKLVKLLEMDTALGFGMGPNLL
ncbi:hypothetical protein MMC31_005126 [Peltigera leucophlebia]|nr:hypothetical protein [Peltigera leucophlebia]